MIIKKYIYILVLGFIYIYFFLKFEREREREGKRERERTCARTWGGAERERGKEGISSRLRAVSIEPYTGSSSDKLRSRPEPRSRVDN